MTDGPLEFTVERNAKPVSDEVRASILNDPPFGKFHTDHMVSIDYVEGKGWHNARVIPYGPIELDPSAIVLHYAQEVFEGLKAYRWADGSIVSFRPEANARRLRSSARRLAIPELPEEAFIESLRQLIAVDEPWVPPAGGEESLYLRPYIFATEPGLGVRPASEYRYLVIASPAGAYFKGGIKPVSVWLSTEYVRACPGGTGAAKFGGNYAASLLAQAQAIENDCDQVVWLDAAERRYVEEMGGMNLFFVFGSGGTARLVTPELSGSILPGVTRDALLQLATDAGFAVEERKIDVDEWQKKVAAGEITEVFACGTAAVITPVARVKYGDGEFTIADGGPGEITMALRDTLTGIQRGTFADTHGWMARLSLTDRQPDGGHRRRHLDRRAQHVAGDPAEPADAVRDQCRAAHERDENRQRPLPPSRIGQHRQRRNRDDPDQHHCGRLGARGAPTQRAALRGGHRAQARRHRGHPACGHGDDHRDDAQFRERQRLQQDRHHHGGDAEGTGRTVAHHLQRPFRRPVTAERIGGVGQPVDVQATGRDQQDRDREGAAERIARAEGPRRRPDHRARQRPERDAHDGQCGDDTAAHPGRAAHGQDGRKRECACDRADHAVTPASSNVAIDASAATAARTTGSATAAPVPSPSRIRMSMIGSSSSCCSASAWAGSVDRCPACHHCRAPGASRSATNAAAVTTTPSSSTGVRRTAA